MLFYATISGEGVVVSFYTSWEKHLLTIAFNYYKNEAKNHNPLFM